jgi:DNA-binding response OmpR family regulator
VNATLANNLCVVDDDEAVRRSLGLLLLSRGYAVQTFASGEAFLASADLQRAGCVVLDLRMEGMSGLQVFDALRAQDSPLVVLFLSGHGDIPMAVEAVQNGAFGWLEKPCNDERLLESIAKALQQAQDIAVRRQCTTPPPRRTSASASSPSVAATSSSGNLVEWFDFYIYAFSAIYFAPAFFPKSDPDGPAAEHRRRVRRRLPDAAHRRLAVRPHRRPQAAARPRC